MAASCCVSNGEDGEHCSSATHPFDQNNEDEEDDENSEDEWDAMLDDDKDLEALRNARLAAMKKDADEVRRSHCGGGMSSPTSLSSAHPKSGAAS